MPLYALLILQKENDRIVTVIEQTFSLQNFGYFQRGIIQEYSVFAAKTIVERTANGLRQSVNVNDKLDGTVHVTVRSNGLSCVLISTTDYPQRVAHNLLDRVLNEFTDKNPSNSWQNQTQKTIQVVGLADLLDKYQNPQQADPLMKLQKEIDETKDILLVTLDNVLGRGERLDEMIYKSNELSLAAKLFHKKAKETNRCCSLLP